MSKTAVLTRFAERMGISIHQARRLQTLVNKAADAQTDEHNTGASADEQTNAVDQYANSIGLGTDWNPGIYPLFVKGEHKEQLPD